MKQKKTITFRATIIPIIAGLLAGIVHHYMNK